MRKRNYIKPEAELWDVPAPTLMELSGNNEEYGTDDLGNWNNF